MTIVNYLIMFIYLINYAKEKLQKKFNTYSNLLQQTQLISNWIIFFYNIKEREMFEKANILTAVVHFT